MSNQRGSLAIILGVIFFVVAIAGGIYYLMTLGNNSEKAPTSQISTQASTTPASSSTPDLSSLPSGSVPTDWTMQASRFCAVKIPVPPNKEPYFEYLEDPVSHKTIMEPKNKRFWQFREGEGNANGGDIFKNYASVTYVADIEATDYIEGSVEIGCSPNTNYTLENIAESYADGFGEDVRIKVKSKRIISQWGKDVVAALMEGGMFGDKEIYFVVTDKKIYKIGSRPNSSKEFVRNTTNKIFENLQFIDE